MDRDEAGHDLMTQGCELVDVSPVIGAAERLYFAEKDKSTQQSHIVCFAYVSAQASKFGRIYSTSANVANL